MERKSAILTGVLFVIAIVAGLAGTSLTGPNLGAPDYLARVSSHANQVVAGALLAFIAAASSAGIAIALYPVLKKHNEGLALGAVAFRLVEAVFYIVGVICLLVLFPLSHQVANAQGQAASVLQTLGNLLLAARDLSDFVFAVMAFGLGALMYYSIFYRSRLVPRWLSGWGIASILLLLSASLLTVFDGEPFAISGTLIFLALPIALQEMVLAVWLMLKGFGPSAAPAGVAGSRRVEA